MVRLSTNVKHADRHLIHSAALNGMIWRILERKHFSCSYTNCRRVFHEQSHWEEHELSHKLKKCKICGETFEQLSVLHKHEKTHPGIKIYVCDLCGKSYSKKYELTRHTKTHPNELTRYVQTHTKIVKSQVNSVAQQINNKAGAFMNSFPVQFALPNLTNITTWKVTSLCTKQINLQ